MKSGMLTHERGFPQWVDWLERAERVLTYARRCYGDALLVIGGVRVHEQTAHSQHSVTNVETGVAPLFLDPNHDLSLLALSVTCGILEERLREHLGTEFALSECV